MIFMLSKGSCHGDHDVSEYNLMRKSMFQYIGRIFFTSFNGRSKVADFKIADSNKRVLELKIDFCDQILQYMKF